MGTGAPLVPLVVRTLDHLFHLLRLSLSGISGHFCPYRPSAAPPSHVCSAAQLLNRHRAPMRCGTVPACRVTGGGSAGLPARSRARAVLMFDHVSTTTTTSATTFTITNHTKGIMYQRLITRTTGWMVEGSTAVGTFNTPFALGAWVFRSDFRSGKLG